MSMEEILFVDYLEQITENDQIGEVDAAAPSVDISLRWQLPVLVFYCYE